MKDSLNKLKDASNVKHSLVKWLFLSLRSSDEMSTGIFNWPSKVTSAIWVVSIPNCCCCCLRKVSIAYGGAVNRSRNAFVWLTLPTFRRQSFRNWETFAYWAVSTSFLLMWLHHTITTPSDSRHSKQRFSRGWIRTNDHMISGEVCYYWASLAPDIWEHKIGVMMAQC